MYPVYIELYIVVVFAIGDGKRAVISFTVAGMDKMEVKNQHIQTEIVKTVEHVQAGSTAKQQGV